MQNILKTIKWKRYINYIIVMVALVLTAVVVTVNPSNLTFSAMITQMAYSVILAVSLNLVVGFLGELSLGHAGFLCVGAYVGCVISNRLYETGMPKLVVIIISMLAGGLAAALMGFIIGLPTLRLKGDYLAIVTLGFGEIIRNLFANVLPDVFGGPSGLTVTKFGSKLCLVALVVTLLSLIVMQNMMRSKHGRAVRAIRDNEIAARATGVNVTYYKLVIFVAAAFFAGVAGVLYGQHVGKLLQSKFDFNYSINILVMVVLGGMGNITGSLLSASALTFLDVELVDVLSGDLAVVKNLIYALILTLLVIYNSAPGLSVIREKYNFGKIEQFLRAKLLPKGKAHDDGVDADAVAQWSKIPTKIEMDALLTADIIDSTGKEDKKHE